MEDNTNEAPIELRRWAAANDLQGLLTLLISKGYDTLWVIKELNDKYVPPNTSQMLIFLSRDIKALKIKKPGDQKKLEIAIRNLREQRTPEKVVSPDAALPSTPASSYGTPLAGVKVREAPRC